MKLAKCSSVGRDRTRAWRLSDLRGFGIAAYCVGLLVARRTLTKYGLAEEYKGEEEPTGEDYNVEAGEGARPFKAFLDVGIKRTSTGAKVFGFLKVRTR
jgi:ribosomal protein L18